MRVFIRQSLKCGRCTKIWAWFLISQFLFFPGALKATVATDVEYCNWAVLMSSGEVVRQSCPPGLDSAKIKNYFESQPGVRLASPVVYYQASLLPNDPGYEYQKSYLERIKAPLVWGKLEPAVLRPIIAVLDSGVDIDNPDLYDNIWYNTWEVPDDFIDNDGNGFTDDRYGWDFITGTPDPRPKFEDGWIEVAMQHGTVVAGVAAAVGNNGQGVAGVAWGAQIMPLRVLNAKGVGDTVTVARAINYAVQNNADIINLSFVGRLSDPILEDAIKRAFAGGVLIVAASGNEQGVGVNLNQQPQYPVCDDGFNGENQVIGVAAVDDNDKLASFSNYGSRCIDASAPGVRIFSTQWQDDTDAKFANSYGGWWSGTSVAAPMVSGALAILKSVFPRLSPSQLRDVIIASGDLIDSQNMNLSGQVGRRINLDEAFKLASTLISSRKSPLVVVPASAAPSTVELLDISSEQITSWLAYHPRFVGGVNLAVGDVNGDDMSEIITGARLGGGPHIKIFNQQGVVLSQFMAFPEAFHGGVTVAAGDINSDKKDEIIVGVGTGGVSTVRIFDAVGNLLRQFVPYDINYTSGVNVAAGDVDRDGLVDIVVAPQSGKRPIRVFDRFGRLQYEFTPYPFAFRGGVNVTVGDADGNGTLDILTAPGAGGGPQVRIFNERGKVINQFFAYAPSFRGGVNLAVGDVDGDGVSEIVTTPGAGGGPHIRVFNLKGEVKTQFFLPMAKFLGGLTVAVFH